MSVDAKQRTQRCQIRCVVAFVLLAPFDLFDTLHSYPSSGRN